MNGDGLDDTDVAAAKVTINNFDSDEATLVDGVKSLRVSNSTQSPGADAAYTFKFQVGPTGGLGANEGKITLHFDKDFGGLDALAENHITISQRHATDANFGTDDADPPAGAAFTLATAPARDVLSGSVADNRNIEYTITVPDMHPADDQVAGVQDDAVVTVTVSSAAGISNPTEAGNKGPVIVYTSRQTSRVSRTVPVDLVLSLDAYNGNRNKAINVTGKGFKDGRSVDLFLDKAPLGKYGDEDTDLAIPVTVSNNDTFVATLTVTVPLFDWENLNYINAIDGNANTITKTENIPTFRIDPLLSVSPNMAQIGDDVELTLRDWADLPNSSDDLVVTIGGKPVSNDDKTALQTSGETSRLTITIPQGVRVGTQRLMVEHKYTPEGEDQKTLKDDQPITIGGAGLSVDPATVVPNQVVSLTGSGFSEDPADGDADVTILKGGDTSMIEVGGTEAEVANLNRGAGVIVDDGNWDASFVIPLDDGSTADPGPVQIKITDSTGMIGVTSVTIASRNLVVDPPTAQRGDTATLTGTGFPATNNVPSIRPTTPRVDISYGTNPPGSSSNNYPLGSVATNSEGEFTFSFTVPKDADEGQTHKVYAKINWDGTFDRTESVDHVVVGARITLDKSEVSPGDRFTVTGTAFRPFISVSDVKVNENLTVGTNPSNASTDANGGFTFTVLVPDLDAGTHRIEVTVGEDKDTEQFKILDTNGTGVMMMAANEPTAPDVAFAAVIAEDNLIAVYHFDPATQNEAPNYGYSVYDARPLFMSGNNLDSIEPGQFYTVEVSEDQMGVTLGSQTVDLYAPFTPIRW